MHTPYTFSPSTIAILPIRADVVGQKEVVSPVPIGSLTTSCIYVELPYLWQKVWTEAGDFADLVIAVADRLRYFLGDPILSPLQMV